MARGSLQTLAIISSGLDLVKGNLSHFEECKDSPVWLQQLIRIDTAMLDVLRESLLLLTKHGTSMISLETLRGLVELRVFR